MIVSGRTTEEQRIVVSNQVDPNEVTVSIKSMANIFGLLHNSMYNDKPTVVAREVISNAIDANTESGSKNKIIINTPSIMNPVFTVEDNGVGINKERLKVFSTYGDSTKNLSDKEIGGYGLGAKSPWSLTDSFTISTTCEGMNHKYLLYIDIDGIGKVKELYSCKTDAPTGTKIEIPVTNPDDMLRIKKQALLWFLCNPSKVNLTDHPQMESAHSLRSHRFSYSGVLPSNYHCMNFKAYDISGEIIVLNGYVPYLIHKHSAILNNTGMCVVVKLPIGVIDLPATRETPTNNKRNNDRFDKIQQTISTGFLKLKSFFQEKVDKCWVLGSLFDSVVDNSDHCVSADYRHSKYTKDAYGEVEKQPIRFLGDIFVCKGHKTNSNTSIRVMLTERKLKNVTYLEYAEQILKTNPTYKHVEFLFNIKNENHIKQLGIVPIHCFNPPTIPKQKLVVKKDVIKEIRDKTLFELAITHGRVRYDEIMANKQEYCKIITHFGNIPEEYQEILRQLRLENNFEPTKKIILVGTTDIRKFKEIPLFDQITDIQLTQRSLKIIGIDFMKKMIIRKLMNSPFRGEYILSQLLNKIGSSFALITYKIKELETIVSYLNKSREVNKQQILKAKEQQQKGNRIATSISTYIEQNPLYAHTLDNVYLLKHNRSTELILGMKNILEQENFK